MRRLISLAASLVLVLALTLSWAAPVRADEESIRHLGVDFAIQADGTVDVRYELQWHFAEKGRRGIEFGIATREPWDADREKDAVYEVSDVRVSSPTGAPAEFTQRESGSDRDRDLRLRIGNPDLPLDTQDATYVIEYTLDGALRTFEEGPEFYWDVTSDDYPTIEAFTVRVTAPGGVTRARCLVGTDECAATTDAAGATYTSTGTADGVITVVAALTDEVADAEPMLEDRALVVPEVRTSDTTAEVAGDGSVAVQHSFGVALPQDGRRHSLRLDLVTRAIWSPEFDQTFEIRDVVARTEDGSWVGTEWDEPSGRYSRQDADLVVLLNDEGEASLRQVEVSYVVDGAVVIDGDTAHLRLPMAAVSLHDASDASASWILPAPPTHVGCHQASRTARPGTACTLGDVDVDGTTVRAGLETLTRGGSHRLTDFTFPAGGMTVSRALEPSLDAARDRREAVGFGGGVLGALATAGGAWVVGRRFRVRDQRYGDVAPGVVGDESAIRDDARTDEAPVAFSPPDLDVREAGLLLDRRYRPTHLAATLVSLAVRGAVRLGSKPLMVQDLDDTSRVDSGMEAEVARHGTREPVKLPDENARKMRRVLEAPANSVLVNGRWFRKPVGGRRWILITAVSILPFALYLLLGTWVWPALDEGAFSVGFGLFVGAVAGLVIGLLTRPRRALSAEGTVQLDRVEGFRTYLATAEADQFDFEADRDIFRRYLPWAVLFGLTERWTRVCEQLAREGRIDPPDVSFFTGSSLGSFDRDVSRFSGGMGSASAPVSSGSSSGGSGSSSGFSSSGGGGGGGGGGTSAGSW